VQALRLVHPAKGRFFEVHWEGVSVELTSGVLGTNGRSTDRHFIDADEAERYVTAQIEKRRREGFVELEATPEVTAPRASAGEGLEAIIANPDDDGRRLVYADQLATAGDPLGEFIQVQLRLASDPHAGQAMLWRHREKELLDRFRQRWSGGLRGVEFHFERGFAVSVQLTLSDLESHLPKLWAAAPLLAELHVTDEGWWRGATIIAKLCATPEVTRLRALHLHGGEPNLTQPLFEATRLSGLRALSIRRARLTDPWAWALAQAPQFHRLEQLDLRGNRLGGGAIDAIAALPLTRLGFAMNQLGQSSVWQLQRARTLTRLRALDLSGNGIGTPGCEALAQSPHLATLTTLGVADTNCSPQGVALLTTCAFTPTLEALDLSNNDVASAVGVLARFPALRALNLSGVQLGDRGLAELLDSPVLPRLQRLDLRRNSLSMTSARRLVKHAGALGALRELSLSGNPLGAAGVRLVKAALPHVQVVTRSATS
jgi:uncharacterized protein (TIGR02996 family)